MSELKCSDRTQRCEGVLDARTNVFRVCLVIVAPLLSRSAPRSAPPAALADRVKRVLDHCLEYDGERRATASELHRELEDLRTSLHRLERGVDEGVVGSDSSNSGKLVRRDKHHKTRE